MKIQMNNDRTRGNVLYNFNAYGLTEKKKANKHFEKKTNEVPVDHRTSK